jgi:hypothetical protein
MRPALYLDGVHAEVLDRTPGEAVVNVSIKVDLERYSAEDRSAEFRYKLVVSSRIGQISMTGTLVLLADSDIDLEELEKIAYESRRNAVPATIFQLIIFNLQPLLLHVEKEMGMPITPLLPGHVEQRKEEREEKKVLLYQ